MMAAFGMVDASTWRHYYQQSMLFRIAAVPNEHSNMDTAAAKASCTVQQHHQLQSYLCNPQPALVPKYTSGLHKELAIVSAHQR